MDKFKGKVAVVTGASSGIGAATAKALVESGMIVVGFARRRERIEALAKETKGKLHAVKVDITKEEDIVQGFKWVTENVGAVHVLVNNAGTGARTELIDGDTEKWRTVMDTNVLGSAIAAREAIKIMRANNIDGHIVNINSVVGHKVINVPSLNLYAASKFAVTAMTETLRLELIRLGSKIKVTSLSPGFVATEIMGPDVSVEAIEKMMKIDKALQSEDIANAVKYIIATPPHVQVTELTIKPVGEAI